MKPAFSSARQDATFSCWGGGHDAVDVPVGVEDVAGKGRDDGGAEARADQVGFSDAVVNTSGVGDSERPVPVPMVPMPVALNETHLLPVGTDDEHLGGVSLRR
jgi:hypothetical protein